MRQITFDENSNIPDDLRYQIYLTNSLEPIENFADYLNRVFKNQLAKHFGINRQSIYKILLIYLGSVIDIVDVFQRSQ